MRSFGSSGVVGFTRLRPWGRSVHPGTFGFTLGDVGFIRGRSVHPESLGSLGFALWFVNFIRVAWVLSVSYWRSLGFSVFVRFTRAQGVVGFTGVSPGVS